MKALWQVSLQVTCRTLTVVQRQQQTVPPSLRNSYAVVSLECVEHQHRVRVQDAFRNGPKEKLAYIPAVQPREDKPDYLMTVDLDPESSTYSQVCLAMTSLLAAASTTLHCYAYSYALPAPASSSPMLVADVVPHLHVDKLAQTPTREHFIVVCR